MLSCKQITELATDYLEGWMPESRRMSFRLHLEVCAACREHLLRMQTTTELLRRLPAAPLPNDVHPLRSKRD